MTQNLDVVISFVVIIMGLSMTLQIVMNAAKHFLNLRWRVYEAFVTYLYRSYLIDREATAPAAPAPRERGTSWPTIQSVTARLRAFGTKLDTAATTSRTLERELRRLGRELRAQSDVAAKADYLTSQLETLLPEVADLAERIRSLQLGRFMAIYKRTVERLPKGEPNGFFERMHEHLARVAELEPRITSWLETKEAEGIEAIEQTLNELEAKITELRQRVGEIHGRIAANLDDALGQLQQRYQNRAQLWCFVVGVLLCVMLNADSVTMYRALRESPELTQSVLAQREALASTVASPDRTGALNDLGQAAAKAAGALRQGVDNDARAEFETFQEAFDQLRMALHGDAQRFATGGEAGAPLVELSAGGETLAAASAALAGESPDGAAIARQVEAAFAAISRDLVVLEGAVVKARLDQLVGGQLPLGWSRERFAALVELPFFGSAGRMVLKLLGLLLTAVLISFGSGFWNDLLEALLGLRRRVGKQEPGGAPTS